MEIKRVNEDLDYYIFLSDNLIFYTNDNINVLLPSYYVEWSLSIFLPYNAKFNAHSEQYFFHGWPDIK